MKVSAHSFLQLLYSFYCSDSEQKMEGELASLMEVYHLVKNAGRSATLTLSSKKGSASTVRLEIELDDAAPSSASSRTLPSTPAPPAPGSQRRHRRSRAKKAKANARAALHQVARAVPASPASGEAPPPPPLPSPPATRRVVTTVEMKSTPGPSFPQLDGGMDLSQPPPPHSHTPPPSQRVFNCDKCGEVFNAEENLITHILTSSSIDCPGCNSPWPLRQALLASLPGWDPVRGENARFQWRFPHGNCARR